MSSVHLIVLYLLQRSTRDAGVVDVGWAGERAYGRRDVTRPMIWSRRTGPKLRVSVL